MDCEPNQFLRPLSMKDANHDMKNRSGSCSVAGGRQRMSLLNCLVLCVLFALSELLAVLTTEQR